MSNMENWNKVSKPPLSALKQIGGGRLRGMTDISPQWRYQAMTEVYGPCGSGWKYTVDRKWAEAGNDGQVMCFADISLYTKVDGEWSEAIPGSGGAMLVELEKNGLHASDEGYKMAVTDALSVAMKMIGMGAEIYLGNFDGTKYKTGNPPPASNSGSSGQKPPSQPPPATGADAEYQERVKAALKAIYGDDKTAALNKVEELTSFVPKGKEEKDRVRGVRDFSKLTGKRLEILAHSLEKLAPPKVETAICNECRELMKDGACRNLSCPEGRPSDDPF